MRTVMLGGMAAAGFALLAQAAEFHVTSAQELQNALTTAAANGEGDTVYVAAGYYTGNFNFNSAEAQSLLIQAESGVANTAITIDGAGTGRSMNLTASAAANITVRGLTFTRNCAGTSNAGLRLSTSGDVLVENCRAVGVTGDQGKGIYVAAAKLATVRGCSVTLDASSSGTGIDIEGVTGGVTAEQNAVSGNGNYDGLYIYPGAAIPVTVTGNNVSSNNTGIKAGNSYNSVALVMVGNTATDNSQNGISVGGCSSALLSGNTARGNKVRGLSLSHSGSGTAALTNNVVTGNIGYDGGGIYVYSQSVLPVILSANTVSGNAGSNPNSGGGIHISGYSSFILTGNTVSGNTLSGSSSSGGGIYIDINSATATLTGNTVVNNQCTGNGGGVCVEGGTLKLANNLIAKNTQTTAGYAGGGIFVKAATLLDLVNNTVTENAAGGNGGGAAFQVDGVTETLHVCNNILWGNTAAGNGKDVFVAGSGSRKEFLYNDAHDLYGVWDLSEHNIDAAPLFYDAANQNYHLRNGSPCLNAGYNSAPSIPSTDIDNEARIAATTVDIGADEMSNTDPHPADLNSDWVISEAEYTAYAAAWKNDQAWSRQPSPVPADYVTRAGYLKQQESGRYSNDGGPKPTCWVPAPLIGI